jgi:hypothetical protein
MTAFLALWNDLAPGQEDAYEAWHTREHVPERVAAPGFRAGRRYVNADHPTHRWFTLYELDGLDALETAEYRDLLANPTPASAAMRPHFRHFLRAPCAARGAAGLGLGGALAVLRLPDEAALDHLGALAAAPGVVRARLGRHVPVEGPRLGAGGAGADAGFAAVLLIEALTRAEAAAAFAAAARRFAPGAAPDAIGGLYDLRFVFPAGDPAERAAHRRAGWPLSASPPPLPARGGW